jgi:hypothetical protein
MRRSSGELSLILGVVATLLAGCTPNDIARDSCESVFLSTIDAWSCTVKGDIVGQASSINSAQSPATTSHR